jgi:chaperone LolA
MRATWVIVIAVLGVCGSMALGAHAESPAMIAAPVNPEVARVEKYLSEITTVSADFHQTAADGTKATGHFFLKRPGKMRWQYAPPTPLLIVSDGKAITYYDAELDQVSYIGVDDTLAGFLAQKDIRLESPTTKLTQFEVTTDGSIRATLMQRKKPEEGTMTLEFSDKPLALRAIEIKDATNQTSRVELENVKFGGALEDKLFTFDDPRGNARRNR